METSKDSNATKHVAYQREELQVEDDRGQLYRRATIDVLPDGVLLDVFNFYLDGDPYHRVLNAWHKLVHVCRRWRQVVFASPRRLNLRLLCTSRRPVKKLLDIWPPGLPIVIEDYNTMLELRGITNIDAALEHSDRVCKITIYSIPSPLLKTFASIKESFPALTTLDLRSYAYAPVLPDSLLGGSVPCLQNLTLGGIILLPGLPNLLLSAHRLVRLRLLDIPDSGYISPEAMVTCLSSLTNLKLLVLEFRSPLSRPDQTIRYRPPPTRTALPSLTSLWFKGVGEYLDDIVARINVPLLNSADITFFNQLIFDTPLLCSFISRAEAFKAFHTAKILVSYNRAEVTLLREGQAHNGVLRLGISCKPSDGLLSSMARVCNSSLPLLPTLEYLNICEHLSGSHWQDDVEEDTQWLELLRPFITVKSLYLDEKFASRVVLALQELAGGRVTEVLPALQNLFVQGPVQQGIAQFIAARRLLGHPVAVQNWDG